MIEKYSCYQICFFLVECPFILCFNDTLHEIFHSNNELVIPKGWKERSDHPLLIISKILLLSTNNISLLFFSLSSSLIKKVLHSHIKFLNNLKKLLPPAQTLIRFQNMGRSYLEPTTNKIKPKKNNQ